MAQSRLHRNLTPKGQPTIFSNVTVDGNTLQDVTVAAQKVNPSWPAYGADICIETFALEFNVHSQYEVPQVMILRGTLSCCCDVYCNYPGHDYSNGGAFATASSLATSISGTTPVTHAPGKGYVESTLDLSTMTPIMNEAQARVPDVTERAAFAAEIKANADAIGLTAEEIESQLGLVDVDTHGLLMGAGSAAAVLAGEDADPTDYFWVAAFVILFERMIIKSHTVLTKDWPNRGQFKGSRF